MFNRFSRIISLVALAWACLMPALEAVAQSNRFAGADSSPRTPDLENCRLHTMDDLDEWDKGVLGDSFIAGKPSLVSGDFNGDGLADEARLLVCKGGGDPPGGFWFVISFTRPEGEAEIIVSYEIARHSFDGVLISAIPVGEMVKHTMAFDSGAPREFLADNGGVALQYLGKSTTAYVWSIKDRTMFEIPTSD